MKPKLNAGHSEILLYETAEGNIKVDCLIREENLWLTQKRMAGLFGVDRSVVTKHLRNIFATGELEENSVCANFAHTAADSQNYKTY